MKVFAFHLLNDFSGSPKVLMQLARAWINNGIQVHLAFSSGRDGFLSDIDGATYHRYWYRWAANPIIRLINLTLSQFLMIGKMIGKIGKNDIVYINTVLPFGAAFIGRIKGCRVIYHIHETTMKPPVLKKILFGIANRTAHDVVYVSRYLAEQEPFSNASSHILYNAIENSFLSEAKRKPVRTEVPSNVLMVCSLKPYKGVNEFVELAKHNPDFRFRLVLNASKKESDAYFAEMVMPGNLEIFNTQTNLHPFYFWADVVLNLSRPDTWVETFGLTIIEGMAYGLPAIVPPVGGITELISDNENGFLVDCRDFAELNSKLNSLMKDIDLYNIMSENSAKKIKLFSEEALVHGSLSILSPKA